jgi:hypothetical protein
MGMTDVACFAAGTGKSRRHDDVDLEPDELGRNFSKASGPTHSPAMSAQCPVCKKTDMAGRQG